MAFELTKGQNPVSLANVKSEDVKKIFEDQQQQRGRRMAKEVVSKAARAGRSTKVLFVLGFGGSAPDEHTHS